MARVLASCEDTALVMEPDNPYLHPFALRKRKLPGGYYTALAPTERAPQLERLWREAFGQQEGTDTALDALRRRAAKALLRHTDQARVRDAFCTRPRLAATLRAAEMLAVPGRPRAAQNVIVKSVQAARALEWVGAHVDAHVVVLQRDLRSVLSSWIALDWIGSGLDNELEVSDPSGLERLRVRLDLPPAPAGALERTTWLLALLHRLMADAVARHPEWTVVRYEDVCDDTVTALRSLADELGLRWSAGAEELVRASNRPGSGYATQRVAAETRDAWRSRLPPEQAQMVASVMAAVGLEG
jgi:hypothetical protein